MLHDLAANQSVVLDEIRARLSLQRDPFEHILDLVIMLSILDKPVGDAEATLKVLDVVRHRVFRSTWTWDEHAQRQSSNESDRHGFLHFTAPETTIGLLRLDVGCPDHLAPFLGLVGR